MPASRSRAGLRHTPCRLRNLCALARRADLRHPVARRIFRNSGGERESVEARKTDLLCGNNRRKNHRVGSAKRTLPISAKRNESLHLSGVSISRHRRHADQFPPASIEFVDAGQRLRRPRVDARGLSSCRQRKIPLLFLRRLHAHRVEAKYSR